MSVQRMHARTVATGDATARHRADRAPELVPAGLPSRRAHLDRRRRVAVLRSSILLLAAVLLVAAVVGPWRPFGEDGTDVTTLPEADDGARFGVVIDRRGNLRASVDVVRSSTSGTPTLSVPDRRGSGFRPRVTVGSLLADSAPVPFEEPLPAGAARELPEAAGASRVALDYTATGTYAASRPSTPGRGLVLLTPLLLGGTALPGRLEVTDPRILNLSCRTDVEQRVCGSREGDTWVVEDLAPAEDVVAQVDLTG